MKDSQAEMVGVLLIALLLGKESGRRRMNASLPAVEKFESELDDI